MINWSQIDSQSLLGKVLRLPLKLIPKGLVITIISGPVKGMKWKVGASSHGCWLGTYELDKQRLIQKWVKPEMVAYDIGANAGFYSLLFSKAVGPRGQVYAFEPLGENAANILNHVNLNCLGNVVVIQTALSNESTLASFAVAKSNSMGSLVNTGTQLRVPTLTLDELINKLGLPAPDVIKMDVEGAESAVLVGAIDLLHKYNTVWFIALHGAEQKKLCQDILVSHGYSIFTLNGGQVIDPLENIKEDEVVALPKNAKSTLTKGG